MLKNSIIKTVKGKIWGDSEDAILGVLQVLRKAYEPSFISTNLLASDRGGCHVLFTVYAPELKARSTESSVEDTETVRQFNEVRKLYTKGENLR